MNMRDSIKLSGGNKFDYGIFNFDNYVNGIYPIQVDLTHVSWNVPTNFGSTDGSYLKTILSFNDSNYYLKASLFDVVDGFIGVESIIEWLAYHVGKRLYFNVLQQNIIPCTLCIDGKFCETVICISKDYRVGTFKLPLGAYVSSRNLRVNSIDDILGYDDYEGLLELFVLDYIMCQRDRHSSNVEYLFDRKTGNIRLAPIFDNGIALTAPWVARKEMFTYENQMYVGPVNNFLGYKDLELNLKTFCKGNISIPDNVKFSDLVSMVGPYIGSDLTSYWLQMLNRRYEYAVGILST